MRDPAPTPILLKDYSPPAFRIPRVTLDVDVRAGEVLVRATLAIERNPDAPTAGAPLVLDGEGIETVSVAIDGVKLATSGYAIDSEHLTIAGVPAAFTLETVVRFDPWRNTLLEGLYATKIGLVTQCEAEGFRHITWFIDRPDVMSTYTVTLRSVPAVVADVR